MADELIDIINDDLSFVKTCLKSKAHKYGWLHASVHIWFYTNNGQVLVQKRSKTKTVFPNLWDVSVAGHIGSGEKSVTAAIREINEEIGLIVSEKDLKYIGVFRESHQHQDEFIDNEIHHIYINELKVDINSLIIQQEELSAIKLLDIELFKNVLKKPDYDKIFVPHNASYYSFILSEIDKYL